MKGISRYILIGFIFTSFILSCGCVRRELIVTSEPSGANVWINEQWHGKTPYRLPFKHYGVFSVRLEKEGYYPMYVKEPVSAPVYQRIGPDLVAEAVLPNKIKDDRELHYVMQKIEEPDQVAGIIERAEEMVAKSEPIIERRRAYDRTRQEVDLPLLPEKNPEKVRSKREEKRRAAMEPPKPREGEAMDKLSPIEPLEK